MTCQPSSEAPVGGQALGFQAGCRARAHQVSPTGLCLRCPPGPDPRLNRRLAQPDNKRMVFVYDVVADPMQVEVMRPGWDLPGQRLDELLHLLISLRTGLAAPPPEVMTAERLKELRLTRSEGYW